MTISSHPLFVSQEEYEAHIVELMKIEAAKPPKPPKTVPDIEYLGDMPVRIYPLNPDINTIPELTREELRRITPAEPNHRGFYEKQFRKVKQSKAKQRDRLKEWQEKYPLLFPS